MDHIAYLSAVQQKLIEVRRQAAKERDRVKATYLYIVAADLEERVRMEDRALCSPE